MFTLAANGDALGGRHSRDVAHAHPAHPTGPLPAQVRMEVYNLTSTENFGQPNLLS